jgi:hypothetical protein
MPAARPLFTAVPIAIALSGCATCSLDGLVRRESSLDKPVRASAAAAPALKRTIADDAVTGGKAQAADEIEERRRWCGQRFIDYQEGKRPGGAATVEQKEADDATCAALRKN